MAPNPIKTIDLRRFISGRPIPLASELDRGSPAYKAAALQAIETLERFSGDEIRAAISIVPMNHIRFGLSIDYDQPPGNHFPCPMLFATVEALLAATLPAPVNQQRDELKYGWDARIDQLRPQIIVDVADTRQAELEEASAVATFVAKVFFLKTNYVRRWARYTADALWNLVQEIEFAGAQLPRERRSSLRYTLTTGREIDLIQLTAAAGVRQADQAMTYFKQRDIEAYSYLTADIQRAVVCIVTSVFEDETRARLRRHSFAAHQRNPAHRAMLEIEKRFRLWQSKEIKFRNDADFATRMALEFPQIKNEGSIKNACSRWRRQSSS